MQDLRKSIARAASLDCAVTIAGEPGTGKELAAQAIHASSRWAHQRFLAIDCTHFGNAQLTRQLLGVTGANLSDAIRTRGGIFAAEPVGTLLLDHVDKMPAHMQEQLLGTLTMAGDQSGAGLNMRITAATEVDLGTVKLTRMIVFTSDRGLRSTLQTEYDRHFAANVTQLSATRERLRAETAK